MGSISELGRSGGRHGHPLQYSCLENPHGQRSLEATIHGVEKSQTQLTCHAHPQMSSAFNHKFISSGVTDI